VNSFPTTQRSQRDFSVCHLAINTSFLQPFPLSFQDDYLSVITPHSPFLLSFPFNSSQNSFLNVFVFFFIVVISLSLSLFLLPIYILRWKHISVVANIYFINILFFYFQVNFKLHYYIVIIYCSYLYRF